MQVTWTNHFSAPCTYHCCGERVVHWLYVVLTAANQAAHKRTTDCTVFYDERRELNTNPTNSKT